MSLVYETIWRNADISKVSMRRFANGLCDYLVSTYENVGTQVFLRGLGEDVLLSLDSAIYRSPSRSTRSSRIASCTPSLAAWAGWCAWNFPAENALG
jgi:hypothetical protein